VIVEDKGYSVALHHRLAPEFKDELREAVAAICGAESRELEVLPGKAVIEIKWLAFNKGTAVRELMRHPPFRGRRPIFVGDDVTDESAFRVLPEYHGLGYSVGRRMPSLAGRFGTPADVRRWLSRMAEHRAVPEP
jgi:trehalose 6-phosphate phosphatase